jgi:tetratricopeptide (TPR) repeat protein
LKPVARRALQLWNTWTIRQYTSEVHIPGLVVTLIMKISFFLAIVLIFAASACAQQDATGPASPIDQAQKLIDANELQKASDLISTFLRRDPANEAATLKLGEIRLTQGLNEDAMKSFEAVLTVRPDSTAARVGEVEAAESAALANRNAGVDGSALLCLIRALKFVPDSPKLLLDFGIQAERMKIYAEAEATLIRALEFAPDDAKVIYALAHVQFDEQKFADAERNLRTYLQAQPDDATAHYGLGRLLHTVLRDDEAKTELERSIALQPRQSSSYYELGEIARETNQLDEAKKNYDSVLAVAPHHGGALTGLGILAFRAKDDGAAERYLSGAVTYAPDFVAAHHYYSLLLARLGRDSESRREAELATTLSAQAAKASHGNELTVIE